VKCPTTAMPADTGEKPVSTTPLARGPNAVLALLGNVGTPTMIRSAPIALETGTMVFGAFTGASKILRDTLAGPCSRYIFNVRGSYAQEARATLESFFSVPRGSKEPSNMAGLPPSASTATPLRSTGLLRRPSVGTDDDDGRGVGGALALQRRRAVQGVLEDGTPRARAAEHEH
jgi:hypothetical protein